MKKKRSDIAALVSVETGIDKRIVEVVMKSVDKTLFNLISNGYSVSLAGFGTFSITVRTARKTPMPKTGKIVEVGEMRLIKFKPSGVFKKTMLKEGQ